MSDTHAVERYLDDIFDRLAGTGRAGRIALAETEDHLRAAVAEEIAAGRSPDEAERAAVIRFGHPARIARQLRRAAHPAIGGAAVSGLWWAAGLFGLALGVAHLVRVVFGWPVSGGRPPSPAAWNAVLLLALSGAVLVGHRWLVRRRGLPEPGRRFRLGVAVAALVLAPVPFVLQSFVEQVLNNAGAPLLLLAMAAFGSYVVRTNLSHRIT
jgi:hypothetical protein